MTKFTKEQLYKKLASKKLQEKNNKKPLSFIVLYVWWILAGVIFLFFVIVYFIYLYDLPSIDKLSQDKLQESIIILDRKWNELYNLYSKEKRTYMVLSGVSKTMQDAIISTEDKTFFENQWIDLKWIARAGINYVFWKSDKIKWTSTISQQLIRNMFLTTERTVKRKVQEIYLSYKLNSTFSKEKILELYLNKISFWSNAFGIEEASKTFFWKPAKNLWILESAILASLPKWPTFYSPYNHEDRLMWYLYVYKNDTPKEKIVIDESKKFELYKPLVDKFKSIITDLNIENLSWEKIKICKLDKKFFKKEIDIDSKWCITMNFGNLTGFLNGIKIAYTDLNMENPNEEMSDLILEYNTWRKDFVLWRMFEDNKLKSEDYKKSIILGLNFKFKPYTENMKYPYFVFYVKEYLENKYWKDFESQWWLKIYTTIDPSLQDKAEELVKKQIEINKTKYGATNAALISIDNKTGQILAMVWWWDYFDSTKLWANVNIITSERQPWSSFKPIEYAYAISAQPISPDTPVYDVDTKFWPWNPDNYDWKFYWRMPLKKALWYSRNIPAIKVFMFAWWEDAIVKFANTLWISSLKLGVWYWAPLWIWTWELKPIELAQAYMVFANKWYKKDTTPILKIEDKKWNVIEEFTENTWRYIFSDAACYIISNILSDPANRPWAFWNNVLTLKDRKVAAKTWTSNKEIKKWNKKTILPMDLWTAGYTPQITTVVWAWNNDWSATKWNCDWLNCAAPIWHDFMTFAHKDLPKMTFEEPSSVIHATISKLSWKLATKSTPANLRVTSIFAIKPKEYDSTWLKEVEVDALCNGKVTDQTPLSAIKKVYIADSYPIIDSFVKSWLDWIKRHKTTWTWSELGDNTITWYSDEICKRPSLESSWISISSDILEDSSLSETHKKKINIRFDANNPITKIQILDNTNLIKEVQIQEKTSWDVSVDIDFPSDVEWIHNIIIKAIDKYYYNWQISYKVDFWAYWLNIEKWVNKDLWNMVDSGSVEQSNLIINMINPKEGDSEISVFQDQYFNLRWSITSSSEISAINIYINNQLFKILNWTNEFSVPVNEKNDYNVWTYIVTIEVIDNSWKRNARDIKVNVLAR